MATFLAQVSQLERFDQNVISDFLNAIVTGMAQFEKISQTEAQEIKMSFRLLFESNIHELRLDTLIEDNQNDFINHIIVRYGISSIYRNIFRFSLTRLLSITTTNLAHLCQEFLQKGKLHFNRPFHILLNGKREQKTLLSAILVEMSENIDRINSEIELCRKDLSLFLPTTKALASPVDSAIDNTVAKVLDFEGVDVYQLPHVTENFTMRKVVFILSSLGDFLESFSSQLTDKRAIKYQNSTDSVVHWLRSEASKYQAASFDHYTRPGRIEYQRQSLMHTITHLNQVLEEFTKNTRMFLDSLSEFGATSTKLPASYHRYLAAKLIDEGLSARVAIEASASLMKYCEAQKIQPNQLIFEELGKLHPQLSKKALQCLQEIDSDENLTRGLAEYKKGILKRGANLADKLKNLIPLLVVTLLFWGGCGVKTQTTSQVPEFRPLVSLKSQVAKPPQDAKTSNIPAIESGITESK